VAKAIKKVAVKTIAIKATVKKSLVKKMIKKKVSSRVTLSVDKDKMTVFHKPSCQTSNTVLKYLRTKKQNLDIIHYIETPPSANELEILLSKLNLKPIELIRKKEKYYQEKLSKLNFNDHEWIKLMVENPILIERPILIKGNKAIIGRPFERVVEFVEGKE
jgi:arsenate reductase